MPDFPTLQIELFSDEYESKGVADKQDWWFVLNKYL